MIYASFKSFVYAMYKKNYANKQYFLAMTDFIVPPIICGIIQIFIQNIPILSAGIMVSFLLEYLNSTETLISIDPLTGISNRRDFLNHLTDEKKSLKSRDKLYLAFLDIDRFVINKVCRYVSKWQEEMGEIVPVSVNLSRNDIYRRNLCSDLLETIEKYNVPPEAIRLEITESSYMEDSKLLIDTIAQLRNSGFFVEMDDFGSGYSSLNSLKDISIDKLKLDMKFLVGAEENKKAKVILSAVINMARMLEIPVIAEGVETEEQAKMLSKFGCTKMQGYYFSRPVPTKEYGVMLKKQKVK